MARLILRNVPKEIVDALAARAKRHGRSLEDEHRMLLKENLFRRKRRRLEDVFADLEELDRKGAVAFQDMPPPGDSPAA